MIGRVRIPSSIASRVGRGRHSIAVSSWLIGSRRLGIGTDGRRYRRERATEERQLAMRLGLHIGYWGLGLDAAEQLELVREAERLGYDSVWSAEAYGSDAVTVLAWLAAQTERIKLGSAILQMPGRSAAMTAMTAATLDQLSGGRVLLGLGTSGPQVAEGWHGQRFARQLQRTREYVEVVRKALRRERLEYHGETLELPLPDGPGKALKLTIAPVQERVPVYIAAIGPRNTALAAEIADGWLPTLYSPEHAGELRPLLEEGFARAGKSAADFDVAPTVTVNVTDDVAGARDAMRPYLALYVGGMGSRERNFYNQLVRRYGFEDAAREVQDLYLEGRKEEAAAALPEALIDAVSLVGSPDVVRERLALFRDAGVGTLIVMPMAWTLEQRREQLRHVAELAA
jgi:F420-dependent oxidoreductase-like protein